MSLEGLAWLLSWAVFYTGYQMPAELPVIQFEPNEYFEISYCRQKDDECMVRAMYDDRHDGVIFINEKFYTGMNAEFKGTLVHEMVHYLQDMSGIWKGMENWHEPIMCQERQYREREAYMTQDKYLDDVHSIKGLRARKFPRCK